MNISRFFTITAAALSVSACAVTHHETNKRADVIKNDISEQIDKQNLRLQADRPLYTRISANYVGRKSNPIAMNASLPQAINDQSFALPRRTNLATAAKIISKLTRYPVRINPDIYISPRNIVPSADAPTTPATTKDMPSNLLSAQISDLDTSLPTDFDGPLKDYLDTICAVLNINWEFDTTKGFYFYRLVTKVLEVKMHAGDNNIATSVSKGSSANTGGGQGSTSGAQSSGSFSSTLRATSDAKINSWSALEASLNAIKSPFGRFAIDQSANSVLVKDTRDIVDLAEQIVTHGNSVHNRMVTMQVRTMRVSYDDSSAAGLDANAAYNTLLANGTPDAQFTLKSPGSLVSADSGSLGFSIVSPLSRWKGTNGLVQAVNQLGTIVSDETKTYVTMNRRTQPIADFETDTYLAETTPASSGALGGSSGIPGLKPATLTTGNFIQLTPTAFDDGSIWIDMAVDQSEKRGDFGTATSGSGETFQQIQLPKTSTKSAAHFVAVRQGESLLLVSTKRDSMSHSNRTGIFGTSGNGQHRREMQIMIITPFVRSI